MPLSKSKAGLTKPLPKYNYTSRPEPTATRKAKLEPEGARVLDIHYDNEMEMVVIYNLTGNRL